VQRGLKNFPGVQSLSYSEASGKSAKLLYSCRGLSKSYPSHSRASMLLGLHSTSI